MHGSPSRGQATIGYALVIGIALIGVVTVVALGATALTDIQTNAGTGAAEQAMTQFDSRTAQVALGDSSTQTISVGQGDGSYEVDPDAGYVRIVHLDHDGNVTGGDDDAIVGSSSNGNLDNDHQIYESELGTVYYEQEGTTIGYQAGGVWQTSGDSSTMISPPEFHYRGSTLTFPIIRVNNQTESPAGLSTVQSGSGSVDLRVTQSDDSADIYPTRSSGYPDTTGDNDGYDGIGEPYNGNGDDGDGDGGYFDNPATNGTIVIYMETEFYGAWAEYFRTRTDGKVDTSDTASGLVDGSTDPQGDGDDEGVVAVQLESTGFSGPFGMPGEGSSLFLQGIEDHSMTNFSITLVPDTNDEAQFKNLQWSMYVEDGGRQFEMHVRHNNADDVSGTPCSEHSYQVTIFYSPAGTDDYHGWYDKDAYQTTCADLDGDGTKDEVKLKITFADDEDDDKIPSQASDSDETDQVLTYQSLSKSDVMHYSLSGRSLIASPTFDEHKDEVGWESVTYDADTSDTTHPSTEYLDGITNHYFSLLGPGFDLTIDDKSSNTVTEGASSGRIEYEGGSSFITYMHITENDVIVQID